MPTFTAEALLAFVLAHKCVPESMARPMVGIAMHENPKLDPDAINRNTNGTVDVGIAQVNTSNFGWTGLTLQTARDPCANIHAAMMVFFAKYNGNPPEFVKVKYARGAEAAIEKVGALLPKEVMTNDFIVAVPNTAPAISAGAALEDTPAQPEALLTGYQQ